MEHRCHKVSTVAYFLPCYSTVFIRKLNVSHHKYINESKILHKNYLVSCKFVKMKKKKECS